MFITITEAVPKFESGKEVSNCNAVFNTETKSVIGGRISITLGERPVLVEEK